eukprot:tig00000144_g9124.t1
MIPYPPSASFVAPVSSRRRPACVRCGSHLHRTDECEVAPARYPGAYCYRCGSPEHLANKCPVIFLGANCGICGMPSHHEDDHAGTLCDRCGSRMHVLDACRMPVGYSGRYCYRCGDPGHVASKCFVQPDLNDGSSTSSYSIATNSSGSSSTSASSGSSGLAPPVSIASSNASRTSPEPARLLPVPRASRYPGTRSPSPTLPSTPTSTSAAPSISLEGDPPRSRIRNDSWLEIMQAAVVGPGIATPRSDAPNTPTSAGARTPVSFEPPTELLSAAEEDLASQCPFRSAPARTLSGRLMIRLPADAPAGQIVAISPDPSPAPAASPDAAALAAAPAPASFSAALQISPAAPPAAVPEPVPVSDPLAAAAPAAAPAAPVDAAAVAKQLAELGLAVSGVPPPPEAKCSICRFAKVTTAFLDCNHSVACTPCAARATICPICNKDILRSIPLPS